MLKYNINALLGAISRSARDNSEPFTPNVRSIGNTNTLNGGQILENTDYDQAFTYLGLLLGDENNNERYVNSIQLPYELVDMDAFNNTVQFSDMTLKAMDQSLKDQQRIFDEENHISEKLRQNNLSKTNILGDGNCLFRCFSVFETGNEENHNDLRKQCCEYIRKNIATFSGFGNINIDELEKLGTYGGEECIAAYCRFSNKTIHVVTKDSVYTYPLAPPENSTSCVLVYYRETRHYDIALPTEEKMQTETNQEIIQIRKNQDEILTETNQEQIANKSKKARKRKLNTKKEIPFLPSSCSNSKRHNTSTKCSELSEDDRMWVNEKYSAMSKYERRCYIRSLIHVSNPKSVNASSKAKRLKMNSKSDNSSRRQNTLTYNLKIKCGNLIPVCKAMFQSTLGLLANNDKIIRNSLACENEALPPNDMRGKHAPAHSKSHEFVKEWVMSKKPISHHYRYLHAPNRLYFPSTLSKTILFKYFTEENPDFSISYNFFRNILCEMGISFSNLSAEECSKCKIYEGHKKDETHNSEICEVCIQHQIHLERANRARKEYRYDADRDWEKDEIVVSADMMKVSLLPELPYKECLFTSRMVVFNETFEVLEKEKSCAKRKAKGINPSVAVVWNESISGRNADDVATAYIHFLLKNGSKKKIIIYADNCAPQNKNWMLFSNIIKVLNSKAVNTETVIIKFLEPGHTSMSADALHQVINKRMKKQKTLCDMSEYIDLVSSCGPTKYLQEASDFYELTNGVSMYHLSNLKENRPYLRSVREAMFKTGDLNMHFKLDTFDNDYKSYDILKATFDCNIFPGCKKHPRGLNTNKKENILKKLLPLMAPIEKYKTFWCNLPVSRLSADILTQQAAPEV